MKIILKRFKAGKVYKGLLFLMDNLGMEEFGCFTLESVIDGIKPGEYLLGLRTIGSKHLKYSKKYGEAHIGMIEVRGVKGREGILIHIGNKLEDTRGCILVGEKRMEDIIIESEKAYLKIYKRITKELKVRKVRLNIC
jgi:hypothetical protein